MEIFKNLLIPKQKAFHNYFLEKKLKCLAIELKEIKVKNKQ